MVRARLKNAADNPMIDRVGFDRVRQNIWQALRDCYPPNMDPQVLRGDPLGESENPVAYLEKQLKKWRLETEQDIEANQLLTTMLRNSIIEAMLSQVKSRLEESFLVHVTTRQLVVISATPGSAYSSDGTPSLYYYDLTTATVQGICPYGDVDDTSEEHEGPRL
ncbi:hypothetical protein chiPu_0009970 [Chiloscyllium punctatum]|uniref:Uncharacterized protein n=1 Tax=Chiloscyllium punctatum TaxID=137246 RepID=A0A401SM94_CHIPU|nr:hypothetical protein [Chiloscyllium punctatum]